MIESLGLKIDNCLDSRDVCGLDEAIAECLDYICEQSNDSKEVPLVRYFISNAYSGIRYGCEASSNYSPWAWQSSIRAEELLNLRRCISHRAFSVLDTQRQCQIHTNIGNIFSNTGRICQAIEHWNKAIAIDPYFSMALFSKAEGLTALAGMLYDEAHIALTYEESYALFSLIKDEKYALRIEAHVADRLFNTAYSFMDWWDSILSNSELGHKRIVDLDHSLDEDPEIRGYQKWCLSNRLYVNPLNDLSRHPVVSHDIFMLPDLRVSVGEGPYLFAMMQQMKQEYISARYMFYQSTSHYYEKHFSDETMQHVNTLDYPVNGLWIEMIKSAFRTSYSILDKIATFINQYFDLKIPDRKLSFRSVWYDHKKRKSPKPLRACFDERPNLPLRGLYWLSKDLMNSPRAYEHAEDYLELEAEAILNLRNRMEHGYVRIVDGFETDPIWSNDFSTTVSYNDLVNKTMLIMKIAREALLYLGFAVEIEEKARRTDETMSISDNVPFMP